jgi:hypothetical protein
VAPSTAPTGAHYLTFTLSADPGYVLNLGGATIQFALRRNGTGPNAVYIYSSVGGFASSANALNLVTPIVSAGATADVYTFPSTSAYNNLFSVEIRVYADQASNVSGQLRFFNPTTGGNIRITGGSVTSCVPVVNTCTSNGPICAGSTLSLSSSATSTITPITYAWNGPNSFSSSSQNPSISSATAAASGTYTVTATNLCGSSSSTTTPFVSSVAVATSTTNETCWTSCDGTATATPSGGFGAYSYAWSSSATTATATSLCHGNYTCTVTDAIGCTGSGSVAVTYNSCAAFPTTTVPCGNTYNRKTTTVSAANVAGAIGYRFSFYDNSTGALVSQYTQASRTLTLSSVPGLYYNTTYKWTVCVNIGNGYGPESSNSCTITFGTPQTTLPCGVYYTKLNSYTAVVSPGGVSNFRFTIYDNTTGAVIAQRTQSSNYLYFNTLTGLYYNTTYKWTVACEYPLSTGGSVFGSESNPSCTVIFGPAQTTVPCGMSYSNINTYSAVANPGYVMNYRFSFYDNTSGVLVAQKTQTSNYIYFNTITGLAYGNTYKWTVACEYPLSTGGSVFGPESDGNCTITFNPPATTIPCGATYVLSSGYSAAAPIYGATGYRFTFYQNNVQVAQRIQTSNYIYFAQVTGLANNQTYNWTVEVKYNSASGPVYGPASNAACTVSFGVPAFIADNRDQAETNSDRVGNITNENMDSIPAVSAMIYPDPIGEAITPSILINGADGKLAIVKILDLTGKQIIAYSMNVSGSEFNAQLNDFPELASGMYLLSVTIDNTVLNSKFVVQK